MIERCPCCHVRLKETEICPRCKADLRLVNKAEKAAHQWLLKSIKYWIENETEKSLAALDHSLLLKKTRVATIFQNFIIQQQYQKILDLLSENQLISAKQHLYKMSHLFSISQQLLQLNLFTDYLLITRNK
ncbi:MAG: hypothetical protein KAH20_13670 [Methylococcales bacterium]|nr:hypothetical protein [Methylococcales bacterium]